MTKAIFSEYVTVFFYSVSDIGVVVRVSLKKNSFYGHVKLAAIKTFKSVAVVAKAIRTFRNTREDCSKSRFVRILLVRATLSLQLQMMEMTVALLLRMFMGPKIGSNITLGLKRSLVISRE